MINNRRGFGLCIGLNRVDPRHYQGWNGALNACINDANDMQRILSNNDFGTTTLFDASATRTQLELSLIELSKLAKDDDTVIITYSGHGGQIPDYTGDESDRKDETWCLYDGQMFDDHIWSLLSLFKPLVNIIIFSDSCHSGTVMKSLVKQAYKQKGLTPMIAKKVYEANKAEYDSLRHMYDEKRAEVAKERDRTLLISGCQDNQYSMDGERNGAFTGALLSVYNSGSFLGSYKKLHSLILRKMPSTQSPNLCFGGKDMTIASRKAFEI